MAPREEVEEGSSQADPDSVDVADPTESKASYGIPITRRQAMAGGGIVALIAAGLGVSHVVRPAEAIQPTIPKTDLEANGWVKGEETTGTVLDGSAGPVNVQATAATVGYENEALMTDVTETEVTAEYLGQTTTDPLGDYLGSEFEQSMGVFAATKIDVTPHIDEFPGGLGRAEVMGPVETQAQEQFEQQLRDAGLENVRQVETATFEIDTGREAILFQYRATFVFEESSASIQGTTVDISGGEIEIGGYLAIWHNGRDVLVATGTHPNENYADTVTETISGQELTLSFDLALTPSSLREELQGYMRRVE